MEYGIDYFLKKKEGIAMALALLSLFLFIVVGWYISRLRFSKSNTCRDLIHAVCYGVNIVVSFIECLHVFKCMKWEWFIDIPTTLAIVMLVFQLVELFIDANSSTGKFKNVRGSAPQPTLPISRRDMYERSGLALRRGLARTQARDEEPFSSLPLSRTAFRTGLQGVNLARTPRIEELAVQGEQSSDTGKTKVVAMAVDEEEKEPIWMRKPEKSTKDDSQDCFNIVGTINEYAVVEEYEGQKLENEKAEKKGNEYAVVEEYEGQKLENEKAEKKGIPKIENTSNLQHVVEAQTPDIAVHLQSGQDVRTQNVMACQAVANIVKSSLGPDGLGKMLVDDTGDVTITTDGAAILKMLEVEHPAAKVLVELAELQDREVGDGTTSVVIIAAELLKKANDLVRNKIDPTSIISGYRLAMREACKYADEKLAIKVEKIGKDSLMNCAKTSMSSKLIGSDSNFFASLVVDSVQAVKTTNARGEVRYPIKGINILKARGRSAKDSYLLRGYALNTGRAAQGMPLRVAPAKIACLDFNLQKTKMQQGVQVLVTDPRELEKIRQREADSTKERIEKILKAGTNVVLTTKGIDDMALKYFVEAGAIAVRRVRKEDLRHVAKATGATAVSTFADMEGEETFDSSFLGYADEVVEERIADDDVIMIKGTKNSSAVSLILRGANHFMLDEMDRALHDALCVVKRTLESNAVVAGGGAVEAALSVYLENLATTLDSKEELAIAEFAESLLVIPKVLAVNAAKDATELVAKLRAYHRTAQTKADKKHVSSMGLDLVKGAVRNNLEAGVIEPAMSKVKIIQFATEAAITIFRINDMIWPYKEEG